jgi:hypothetical protein
MSNLLFVECSWNHQTKADVMNRAATELCLSENVTGVGHLQNATVDWPTEMYVTEPGCCYADWIHVLQCRN